MVFQFEISGKDHNEVQPSKTLLISEILIILNSESPLMDINEVHHSNIPLKFVILFIPFNVIYIVLLFNLMSLLLKCEFNSYFSPKTTKSHLSLLFSTNLFPNIFILLLKK